MAAFKPPAAASAGQPLSLSAHYKAEEHSVTLGLDHVQSGEAFAGAYELGKVIGKCVAAAAAAATGAAIRAAAVGASG